MPFKITLTRTAAEQLHSLEHDEDKKDLIRLRKVRKCLAYLQTNPKHPSLKTHQYTSLEGQNHVKVWEAYVENKTPAAWRIFGHYGPNKNEITIIAIIPHP